jgi:hypothetical protein
MIAPRIGHWNRSLRSYTRFYTSYLNSTYRIQYQLTIRIDYTYVSNNQNLLSKSINLLPISNFQSNLIFWSRCTSSFTRGAALYLIIAYCIWILYVTRRSSKFYINLFCTFLLSAWKRHCESAVRKLKPKYSPWLRGIATNFHKHNCCSETQVVSLAISCSRKWKRACDFLGRRKTFTEFKTVVVLCYPTPWSKPLIPPKYQPFPWSPRSTFLTRT